MPAKNGESNVIGEISDVDMENKNVKYEQVASVDMEGAAAGPVLSDVTTMDTAEVTGTEFERRRAEHIKDLSSLDRQFRVLREQYYAKSIDHLEKQLLDMNNESALNMLEPFEELKKQYNDRLEMAETMRNYRLQVAEREYEAEKLATIQDFESKKQLTKDQMRDELQEKLRRLIKARNSSDTSWPNWSVDKPVKITRKSEKEKSTPLATAPVVVYMLTKKEIEEDCALIRNGVGTSKSLH